MKLPILKKGFAGKLAETFVNSKLTPVTIMVSLLLGVAAVFLTPKEEEPQITVPMIDIVTPAPGFDAYEIEKYITKPIEKKMWGINGVEYIYSTSMPHGSMITVRFLVNEDVENSLIKIYHKLNEVKSELPKNAMPSEVKSYSIDDVPFLALTFSSNELSDFELRKIISPLKEELSSTEGVGRIDILGGQKRSIKIVVDSKKLESFSVTMASIYEAISKSRALMPSGKNWGETEVFDIEIGENFKNLNDIENLSVGLSSGRIVRLKDVAKITDGPEERVRKSLLLKKDSKDTEANSVTLSFSKKMGVNVVDLSQEIQRRVKLLKEDLPKGVDYTVIRDYGETAGEKSNELIEHLIIATVSVTILIALVMGLRAAIVVAIAIPVTLALTLAIYYFMGYTLNRVTLFALIFSIGILVDDAIVVVENIERYLKTYKKLSLLQATLRAVSEVGNPTILATFAVIAAILPMAFVRGLMGPYMKPIPIGASLAMIFSLFVAFIVTPWASIRLLKKHDHEDDSTSHHDDHDFKNVSKLDKLYIYITEHLLSKKTWMFGFLGLTLVLFIGSASMVYFKSVKVKMLPFDNKNEFQVTLDYPPTTPLKLSVHNTTELAQELLKHEDIDLVQIFSGEAAPYSFSGMVKHAFLRNADYMSDLQIVLKDKSKRKKSSHDIINDIRPIITSFSNKKGAISKVLEIPPGPPVMATMVAEIYGKDLKTRREAGEVVKKIFEAEESVIDLDYTWRETRPRNIIPFDYEKGNLYGVRAQDFFMLSQFTFNETKVTNFYAPDYSETVDITLALENKTRQSSLPLHGQKIPSREAGVLNAENLIKESVIEKTQMLHRKNLQPVEYVLSELHGAEEAPVYGIFKIEPKIPFKTQTASMPTDHHEVTVKWDGEWFITYEVFRDLGGAFAAVVVLIYILVVGWFRSFIVPIVIMIPIPISLIGILPGHYLTNTFFTATSMIGFIAGAGIIVRNSIILVDFIEHNIQNGMDLKKAVISSGVLRFRPMLLTAAALVVGSSVMLFDPIFQGLAISLIFGEVAATLLSRFAVPVFYYWLIGKKRFAELQVKEENEDIWGELHD